MKAILTLSLGGTYPSPPNTRRGTIDNPIVAFAACFKNLRRETEFSNRGNPKLFFTSPPKPRHSTLLANTNTVHPSIRMCRGLPHYEATRHLQGTRDARSGTSIVYRGRANAAEMQAASATFARATCLGAACDVWDFFAQSRRQIDLVVLLLHQDLADLFGHRILTKALALPDAVAVLADRLVFVFEVESQHLSCILRGAYRLGSNRRHFAEIIDLPGNRQRMIEFLFGVNFKLTGNIHVLRAA